MVSWFWCLWALLGSCFFFPWRSFQSSFGPIFPVCQMLFLVSVKLLLLVVLDAHLTESSNCCCTSTRGIQDCQENLSCLEVFMMWGTGWWWQRTAAGSSEITALGMGAGAGGPTAALGCTPGVGYLWPVLKRPCGFRAGGQRGCWSCLKVAGVRFGHCQEAAARGPAKPIPSHSRHLWDAGLALPGIDPSGSLQSPPPFLTLRLNFSGSELCPVLSVCERLEPRIEHTEWFFTSLFRLEGAFKAHSVQPPAVGGDTFNYIRFLNLTKAWFDP